MGGAPVLPRLRRWLHGPSGDTFVELPPQELEDLRRQALATLDDCCGPRCEQLRWRLQHAREVQDLWLLRGEIYQQVAREHCQSQAALRVNQLLPAFAGWLPPHLLVEV